jgi:thiol-disulfide isomerase/thioredoxin
MHLRSFLPLVFASIALGARGQFYAPETEYHDNAQRVFPVEAARVLAWVQNKAGAAIASVDYTLETTADHESVWKLRWLDATGKVLREKIVRYPDSSLTSGAGYFRDVVAQIQGDDWKPKSASPDNASVTFWQGAEAAGLSRLEGLKAASNLLKDKPAMGRPADCARMAGILTHTTLPRFGNPVTIDGVLLARAATWLTLAEGMSREKFDAAWASILALTWREKAAMALWTASPKKAPEKMSAAERFWNHLFSQPSAKDMYLFAARSANRSFAMPMMIYPSAMEVAWTETTIDVASDIVGPALLPRLHEYLPMLVMRGGVAGGHFGSKAPRQFFQAYERFLREFEPAPLDFTGYRQVLEKLPAADADQADETLINRIAPIANLGFDEGTGALTPVAHATTRDVLGYGWEMTGIQLGYRHLFLAYRLADKESAAGLAKGVLSSIKGVDVYFRDSKETPLAILEDRSRLQCIGSSMVHRAIQEKLPAAWKDKPDTYLRRIWLSRVVMSDAVESFVLQNGPDDLLKRNLQRLMKEGGPMVLHSVAMDNSKEKYPEAIRRIGLSTELQAEEPWTINLEQMKIWEQTGAKGDLFGYAQELEKLCWKNAVAKNVQLISMVYLQCNAIQSAKRFYEHIRPFVSDSVEFSNSTGPQRFTLAWWEKDEAGMKQALQDSSTYSWSDLKLQACFAAHSGDLSATAQIIQSIIDRYNDKDGNLKKLIAYLDLVPALKDSNHADHAKAVDSFPRSGAWRLLQWILLKQAALNDDEAARFLGGDAAIEENRAMVAYVKHDKEAFTKAFEARRWKSQNSEGALIALMRNELMGIEPPAEQADLMPADAKPLSQLIGDALNSNTTAEIKETMDFSKYKTAEEFWAAVEKLREMPQRSANSPEDRMRQIRAWLESRRTAAEAFLKAYPNDPHRHSAKLMAIDSSLQLARFGEKDIAKVDDNQLDAIINAADADETTKGEAEFFKLMVESQQVEFSSPHTVPPFQQALAAYLEKYPKHDRAPYVAAMLTQILAHFETPSTEPLLKKLTKNPNEQIAEQAKSILQQRQFMLELKKKPLDLKFTAADGTEVDTTKLRGKVVLLDFWASWCGPCMAEAPHVVATYKKLRERGFEIIGINLDQDKAAMESALKSAGMTWPQHFDGKGWQTDIAQRFGVRAIPSTWLFDKQGKLREHDLRGQELEARIENLLKEK